MHTYLYIYIYIYIPIYTYVYIYIYTQYIYIYINQYVNPWIWLKNLSNPRGISRHPGVGDVRQRLVGHEEPGCQDLPFAVLALLFLATRMAVGPKEVVWMEKNL